MSLMKKKSKSNDVVLRADDMKFANGASYSGAVKDTEIEIKLTYGGPSEPNSYCFAAGSIAK